MKLATLLFLTSLSLLSADEITEKLNVLFDSRIKRVDDFTKIYQERIDNIEKEESRDYLNEHLKPNGKAWAKFLEMMKSNPDIAARIQLLRSELDSDIANQYWEIAYTEGIRDELAARGQIAKLQKQLKTLEAIEKEHLHKDEKTQ
ncbi:MAG: hypothetical protein ACSHYF_09060 [Verrucomicrobiaceae bacterium]